jgi:hypothetical protein
MFLVTPPRYAPNADVVVYATTESSPRRAGVTITFSG